MTCYETLRTPAPADHDAPMAHHFVKWWRNKFRNGYKKFSIGTESERTDTEELVGRAASQCSAPPDLLPSEARALLLPSTPPPSSRHTEQVYKPPTSPLSSQKEEQKPRLRFEELTCDVELQHPAPSKKQPLQFSFTLYDLDGHGRMTKDDIAGIVSTIYESIGKSVTVPHYGSKTIEVKLTVIPDDGSERSQRNRRESRRRRKVAAANRTPPNECVEQSDEEHRDRLSLDDEITSKSSCSEERKQQMPAQKMQNPRPHRYSRREQRDRKHQKKRSGSLQRRELLEIIQANMEKNHLSFQTAGKPSYPTSPVNEEEVPIKNHKFRNRSHTVNEKPINSFQKKPDNIGHGYLDLASGGDSNLCRYDRYLHAVICSSARHANTGYHQKQPTPRLSRQNQLHNSRSRSHDTPGQSQTTQPRVLQIILL